MTKQLVCALCYSPMVRTPSEFVCTGCGKRYDEWGLTADNFVELEEKLCNKDCNRCPLVNHPNSRMLTLILNTLYEKYGLGVYKVVERNCPNLTCCFDCHIDDFCHVEGCVLTKRAIKDA